MNIDLWKQQMKMLRTFQWEITLDTNWFWNATYILTYMHTYINLHDNITKYRTSNQMHSHLIWSHMTSYQKAAYAIIKSVTSFSFVSIKSSLSPDHIPSLQNMVCLSKCSFCTSFLVTMHYILINSSIIMVTYNLTPHYGTINRKKLVTFYFVCSIIKPGMCVCNTSL